jgi:toxin YoeB
MLTDEAKEQIRQHGKSGALSVRKKISVMLDELKEHPRMGTGHPKPLGGNRVGQWSRKITDAHRLVYVIDEEHFNVTVIAARGHYGDR